MRIAPALKAAGASVLLTFATPLAIAKAEDRPPPAPTSTPIASPKEEPTPFGYFRDERGKIMQTSFDMNRRVWLGGGWAPAWRQGGQSEVGRGHLEMGIRADSYPEDAKWRGRFRLLEGRANLGNTLSAHGTLFSYDESRESTTPLLRLTTFWPRPARHDLFLNVGFWSQLLDVSYKPREAPVTQLRPVALGFTLDLWHSVDLEDFLRLRIGGGFDDTIQGTDQHAWSATGIARLESDIVIDPRGFHRVVVEAGLEGPVPLRKPIAPRTNASATLGYEVIVIAINDQPVSFRVAGNGAYRNDLPVVKPGFEIGADAGLRVNLWAPAPRQRTAQTPSNANSGR